MEELGCTLFCDVGQVFTVEDDGFPFLIKSTFPAKIVGDRKKNLAAILSSLLLQKKHRI